MKPYELWLLLSIAIVRGRFSDRPGNKRMLENRYLRYFIEVARSLHLRRAAGAASHRRLHLLRTFSNSRASLGVELFHHESRHLPLGLSAVRFRSKDSAGRLSPARIWQFTVGAHATATIGPSFLAAIAAEGFLHCAEQLPVA